MERWQKTTQSGIEDHTFGPTNVREYSLEGKLALGKNSC